MRRHAFDTRDSADIVFLATDFRQSTKYLFLALLADSEFAHRVAFVSRKPRVVAVLQRSRIPAFLWVTDAGHQDTWHMLARARLVLTDGTLFNWPDFQSLKALIQDKPLLQLWHGVPSKDIGYDHSMRSDSFDHFAGWHEIIRLSTYVNCPSEDPRALEAYSRDWPRSTILNLPEARRWGITPTSKFERLFGARVHPSLASLSRESLVLWAPTHRTVEGAWSIDDVHGVASACQEADLTLLVRPHPSDPLLREECWKVGIPHHHMMSSKTDIYPFLNSVSAVVTDFSSLAYDFPYIWGRGIVHEAGLERYAANRDIRWLEPIHGARTTDSSQLLRALIANRQGEPLAIDHEHERRLWKEQIKTLLEAH